MSYAGPKSPRIAIACGGTGGHLFPGLAVAHSLVQRGCGVTLLISPKEVDQQAVKMAEGMDIVTLPAVGLKRGGELAFLRGFSRSYRAARNSFRERPPHAALAMGGFTSAPPVLAAKRLGAQAFLHESNTIPGRANRWLSWVVNRAFIGFPCAASRLHNRLVTITATPVRPQFQRRDAGACRTALGLEAGRPVLVVMGGSQGASAINDIILHSLPLLARRAPEWQWFHLTGLADTEKVRQAYAALGIKAVVHSFFAEMDVVLGAASAAISRAGASSLAEFAAMRVPAMLVPYPAATENHQFHNAMAYAESGAARLLDQKTATPEVLARLILDLVENPAAREKMQAALAQWHRPQAAEEIAETMIEAVERKLGQKAHRDIEPKDKVRRLFEGADPFPLAPALSLREREQQRSTLESSDDLRCADRLATILPLPRGEGRGEGKRDGLLTHAHDTIAGGPATL